MQTDKRRDPVKLLAFTGAHPGMKVLDMGAGGGYRTELMARAVAPSGVVYGQNPADIGERAKSRFEARLNTPGGKNIVSLARPFDDPLPADVRDLDLITFLFFYHDTTYMPVERAEMNRKLYAALKPGGILVIADHSAKPGAGTSVGKSLHRIEESALRREVEAAGFKLVAEGDFGATLRMRATSRSNRRAARRSTSSCSNSRSRCERPPARAAAQLPSVGRRRLNAKPSVH